MDEAEAGGMHMVEGGAGVKVTGGAEVTMVNALSSSLNSSRKHPARPAWY